MSTANQADDPNGGEPKPKSRKKFWIAIAGVAVATAVANILILSYIILPSPTPAEASEQYIEDHYDAIAEDITYAILPDSPLKAELAAEVLESVAERTIPYYCQEKPGQAEDVNPVVVHCAITVQASKPAQIEIMAPFVMTVDPDRDSFKADPRVMSSELIIAGITVNGLSYTEVQSLFNMLSIDSLLDRIEVPDKIEIPKIEIPKISFSK